MQSPSDFQFVPKRGRPSKQQAEAIDRTILASAARLFFEAGSFETLSMDTVAIVSGVSKGTLYARYPTKKDLLVAVVLAKIAEWAREPVSTASCAPNDVLGRLRVHARNLAISYANPEVQALNRVIMSTGGRIPEISNALVEHGFVHTVNQIAADLESIAGKNYRDAKAVATAVASAIIGRQSQYSLMNEATTRGLVEFADRLVEIMVLGEESW